MPSLWQSYKTLSPRTRLFIGAGLMLNAAAGIFLSDVAEKEFGYTPSETDRERLREAMPKVRVVDREDVRRDVLGEEGK